MEFSVQLQVSAMPSLFLIEIVRMYVCRLANKYTIHIWMLVYVGWTVFVVDICVKSPILSQMID